MKNLFSLFLLLAMTTFMFTACSDANKVADNVSETVESTAKKSLDLVKDQTAQAVKVVNKTGKGYQVGDKAADFKLKNVDGTTVSLGDMKDAKGYIVTFTCNHCPYSVLYEDRLIDLHNEMAAKGYPVVAINPNDPKVQPEDSFEGMQERAKEKKFPFVYLFDDNQQVYPLFGATRTPHVFLLDKDMVVQYIGAIDNNAKNPDAVTINYVEDAIMALEKGTKPDPNFTKAIGCSIKTEKI